MIRHIVMCGLEPQGEGASRVAKAAKMKALLDSCAQLVPGIRRCQPALAQPLPGPTCEVVLLSEFDDKSALDAIGISGNTWR